MKIDIRLLTDLRLVLRKATVQLSGASHGMPMSSIWWSILVGHQFRQHRAVLLGCSRTEEGARAGFGKPAGHVMLLIQPDVS